MNDKPISHYKEDFEHACEELKRQDDLIRRLTEMNARAQYDRREVVRIADQAFKILGSIGVEV